MTLPVNGYLETAGRTVGEMKAALEQIRDHMSRHYGSGAAANLEIATGSVTIPTRDFSGWVVVDSEGATGADDLDHADQTNTDAGQIVVFKCLDAARPITIRNNQAGAGEFLLADADLPTDTFILDDVDKWIAFRRVGTAWEEVARHYANDWVAFQYRWKLVDIPRVRAYSAGPSSTWNRPTDFTDAGSWLRLTVIGGGGGGSSSENPSADEASAGAGGGAGAFIEHIVVGDQLGATETVTIGAGGAAGGAGTASSFTRTGTNPAATITAAGGAAGAAAAATNFISRQNIGGAGGAPSGTTATQVIQELTGQSGEGAFAMGDGATASNSVQVSKGGDGGSTPWGKGGRGAIAAGNEAIAGQAGTGYGSGGGGGAVSETTIAQAAAAGGAGAGGIVFVEEFD